MQIILALAVALLGLTNAERRTHTAFTRPLTLKQGEVTNAFHKLKIPMGPIAVYRFAAEVVEIAEDGTVIPTSTFDAYLHHHVVGSNHKSYEKQKDEYSPMKPKGLYRGVGFGAGTECRGTPQEFYYPYAFFTNEGEDEWFANVHIINTRNMTLENAHKCLECPCTSEDVFTEGKVNGAHLPGACNAELLAANNTACSPTSYIGGLHCCEDGEHCLEKNDLMDTGSSTYYLQYTIEYDDIQPANREVYLAGCCDATGDLTNHGNIEYDLPKCDPSIHPGCVHTLSTRQRIGTSAFVFGGPEVSDVDREIELVFAVAHQHRSGLGMHLYKDKTDELLCSSIPRYGDGHVAGNEKTYVAAMTTCTFNPPIRMNVSDIVRIVALYNNTEAHTGVMSLWYLAIADVKAEESSSLAAETTPAMFSNASPVIIVSMCAFIAYGVYRVKTRKGYSQLNDAGI